MEHNGKYIIREFYGFKPDAKLIFEAEEQNKPIIMSGILQKANTLNRNGRVYPYDILRREGTNYMKLVEEGLAGGECVPAGTEIFTKNGWINIEDAIEGDEIFTLDYENNLLQIQSVTNTIKKHYNDQMVHIYNSKNLDMMVTKKHKVVLWDRNDNPYVLTAEELYEKIKQKDSKVSHSYIKNSGNWHGDYSEFFVIPNSNIKIKSEDWAAFLGIYLAEGHANGTKGGKITSTIGISQTKEETKSKIKELLDKLPFEYSLKDNRQFLINNEKLHSHLFELGNSYTKKIPEYAKKWSKDLLSILIDWMLIGDGKNRKNRKGEIINEYCTTSPQLAEDTFEIMLKLGHGATTSIRIPQDRKIENRIILAENSKPLHIIHQKTTKGIFMDCRFIKADLVDFNDNVYCVSVPNKTWLMRYNNCVSFTHNCDHPDSAIVSLANISHRIIDMWWQGEELYGKVMIAYTPAGEILKGLLKTGFKLGISSRGVGSVKTVKGEDIVQDDFELIAFDFVSSPSTPGAYMFKENRQWGLTPITEEQYKNIKCENGICRLITSDEDEKIILPEQIDLSEPKNCQIDGLCDGYRKLYNLSNNDFWKKI